MKSKTNGWNPRYIAFSKAQGHTPAQQFAADAGTIGEFMRFMNARWSEWQIKNGKSINHSEQDQKEFDLWLNAGVEKGLFKIPQQESFL